MYYTMAQKKSNKTYKSTHKSHKSHKSNKNITGIKNITININTTNLPKKVKQNENNNIKKCDCSCIFYKINHEKYSRDEYDEE
jgi:hypothetical protein